jgi:ABC-type dipeptide/oligopeptide/nickel transport system permease component
VAHVVRPVGPQLFAVAGISASLAFGASIPVEVICDVPGIGQLVWKAALGRDLPLLVTITMLVCLMTMVVNAAADLFITAWPGGSNDVRG